MSEARKERRDYLKSILGIGVGFVIGGAIGWFAKPKEKVTERVTETILGPTVTEREMITETISGPTETVTKTVRIGFETGLESEGELNKFIPGYHWLENPNPKHCIVSVTDEITPHGGKLCGKFELKDPSGGEWFRRLVARVNYNSNLKELYGTCWHFIPEEFPRNVGAITAFKEWDGKTERAWRLYARWNNMLRVHEYYEDSYNLDVACPLREWFRTTSHIIRDPTDGLIEFYLNGELIFKKENVRTTWYEPSSDTQYWFSAHFLYVDIGDPPCCNYFDDVVLSDSWIPLNYVYGNTAENNINNKNIKTTRGSTN